MSSGFEVNDDIKIDELQKRTTLQRWGLSLHCRRQKSEEGVASYRGRDAD